MCARCLQCSRSAGGAAHSFMPRETSFRRLCSLHESRLPPARRRIGLSLRTICSADVTVRDSPVRRHSQDTPHAKRPDSSTGRDDEYRDDRVCQRVRGHWRIVCVSWGGRRMTYTLRRNACGPYASGLTRAGVEELRTAADVDAAAKGTSGSLMIAVNSVCGCGADIEATDRARHDFTGYQPSSPSVGLFATAHLSSGWSAHRSRIATLFRSRQSLLTRTSNSANPLRRPSGVHFTIAAPPS